MANYINSNNSKKPEVVEWSPQQVSEEDTLKYKTTQAHSTTTSTTITKRRRKVL